MAVNEAALRAWLSQAEKIFATFAAVFEGLAAGKTLPSDHAQHFLNVARDFESQASQMRTIMMTPPDGTVM